MRRPFWHILWLFAFALLTCSLVAQQSPQKPAAPSVSPAKPAPVVPDPGTLSDGVYRNPFFGFTYKAPYGWVDRTAEMAEDSSDGEKAGAKALMLLGTFERPPEATSDTVNSGVVIAAESVAAYPGLKTAADYFGPVTELTTAKGFTLVNEAYEFPVDGRAVMRADFRKDLGKVTMFQSTFAILEKGYVVSFTLIGGSDDEVSELLDGLTFGKIASPRPHK